jgi:phage repressor protein C with HTH and peptisase S24 domain
MKMRQILSDLMKANGDDAYSLQEKCGVPQPTTQRFLSGKHKSANTETVKKWAEAYGIKESQLRGDQPLDGVSESLDLPPNSYAVDRSKISFTPVFGKAMGGLPDNLFTDEGREVHSHDEYGEVYSSDTNAFITRVEGNSMFPKYHHHGYALVEPNTPPEIEDEVLIKINTGQVMLKRLVSRRGGVVLSSYNDKEIHSFTDEEITWMYYVAYPVPARKIKHRL